MQMGRIIGEKILKFILTLFLISLFLFSIFYFMRGDSSGVILAEDISVEARRNYALSADREGSFLYSYLSSMWRLISFDWGNTVSGESILNVVMTSLPVTASLSFYAFLLSFPFSLFLSIRGCRSNGLGSLISEFLSSLLLLLPTFLSSIILIVIFSSLLRIFPVAGYVSLSGGLLSHLRTVFLPSLALSLVNISFMLRLFREALRENMAKPFVTYELAKGVKEKDIVMSAVLKPSLPVIISATAQSIVSFFASSAVVETIFAVPGMGRALVNSAHSRDSSLSFVLVMIEVTIICTVLFASQLLISILDRRGERENGKD